MTKTELKQMVKELIEEIMAELNEMSSTGGVAGYMTPNAFGKAKDDVVEKDGWTRTEKTNITFKPVHFSAPPVYEANYRKFRKETISPKQTINRSISEINGQLYRLESMVSQNLKLKKEAGLDGSKYWDVTKGKLQRISERMISLSEKIRKLGF